MGTIDTVAAGPREREALETLRNVQAQMEELNQQLRTVRHTVNNDVAIIMAMAELSQRNPAHTDRLRSVCMEKAPNIAAMFRNFSDVFASVLRSVQEAA
jgi:hypothetical protein